MNCKKEMMRHQTLVRQNTYVEIYSLLVFTWINILLTQRQRGQELIKQQEKLLPLEQAARQKVTELQSTLESEKSQSSALKAILEAKDSKQIDGIYGRLGDLGAIDGDTHLIWFFLQ